MFCKHFYDLIKTAPQSNVFAKYFDAANKVKEVTYREALERISNFMKALVEKKMVNEIVEDGVTIRSIGFLSKNQLDGTLLDLASIACGYTTVPL